MMRKKCVFIVKAFPVLLCLAIGIITGGCGRQEKTGQSGIQSPASATTAPAPMPTRDPYLNEIYTDGEKVKKGTIWTSWDGSTIYVNGAVCTFDLFKFQADRATKIVFSKDAGINPNEDFGCTV